MSINTGWTNPNTGCAAAQEAARRLDNLIGREAYLEWCEAQRIDGYLPWIPKNVRYNWPELTRLATAEYERLTTEDCDCGANGRDVCPLCAKICNLDGEVLPY